MAVIKEIIVYPVKACRGIAVTSAAITDTGVKTTASNVWDGSYVLSPTRWPSGKSPDTIVSRQLSREDDSRYTYYCGSATGFSLDRNFMVVSEKGRHMTQRQHPQLALIETALPAEVLAGQWELAGTNPALTLSAPGMEPCKVSLTVSGLEELQEVRVWEWKGMAYDQGDAVALWLTQYIGTPARLVRYAAGKAKCVLQADHGMQLNPPGYQCFYHDTDDVTKPHSNIIKTELVVADVFFMASGHSLPTTNVKVKRATETSFADGFWTAFSDEYPFLLASEASLEWVNKRLPDPVLMDRFRPNLVVSGCQPFEEESWAVFNTGAGLKAGKPITFKGVKPCDRCVVTTVDQATGKVGKQPLDFLKEVRSGKALNWQGPPSWANAGFFGVNLVALGPGTVSVGDVISVSELQTHPAVPADLL